jgi:hypothetical protein
MHGHLKLVIKQYIKAILNKSKLSMIEMAMKMIKLLFSISLGLQNFEVQSLLAFRKKCAFGHSQLYLYSKDNCKM